MSPPKSTEPLQTPVLSAPTPSGPQRKAKPDLYTVFLVIALLAVLIGILFLYLEMSIYEFKIDGGPPLGMIAGLASTPCGTVFCKTGVFLPEHGRSLCETS